MSPKLSINSANGYYLFDKDKNLFTGNNDKWINLDNISTDLINATLAIEDKNFYKHFAKFKELKAVYDQIKLLEPLCQQSLLYFMNKFIEQDNFSVQNIISSLDKNIFEILATKNIAE